MKHWGKWVPLALAALLFGMFLKQMSRGGDSTSIASQWVGKPVPTFALSPATPKVPGLASTGLATGRPRLLNIFASWCGPCAAEAGALRSLKAAGVAIDGIAVRDRPEDVARFLRQHGNPFDRIGADPDSSVQIALGSAGVPETFLIDGKGIIRAQYQGAITDADVPAILRQIRELR